MKFLFGALDRRRHLTAGQAARLRQGFGMDVWTLAQRLDPGQAPVPMTPIGADWWGRPVDPAPCYALVRDPGHLWLLAAHGRPARAHPEAGAGEFREGLWEHDVAELFLSGPAGAGYLECNLSPTGAWWMASFRAPRVRRAALDPPPVLTHHSPTPDGGWLAALGVPLSFLEQQVRFGAETRANVTMILGHPQPRFLSAVSLGEGDPDYHRPDAFAALRMRELV